MKRSIVVVLVASIGACGTPAATPSRGATTTTSPHTETAELPRIDDLEVSVGTMLCVRRGGAVWCRGDGVGVGDDVGRFVPVAGITDAIALSTGRRGACVVHRGGAVSCWGGIGEHGAATQESATPARIAGIDDATGVSTGDLLACARTSSGQVKCWGIGDGSWRATAVAGVSEVVEVGAGQQHACARRQDGSVWCWGSDARGGLGRNGAFSVEPFAVPGISDAISLDVTRDHACALTREGRVLCWGNRPLDPFEVQGGLTVGVGSDHVCVLRADGTVRCAGDAAVGQLGDGRDVVRAGSADVPGLSGARALSVSGATSCAWSNVAVWCWGQMPEASATFPSFRAAPRPLAGFDALGQVVRSIGLPVERVAIAELPAHVASRVDALRLRAVSVHQAAQFIAQLRRANVLVATDAGTPAIEVSLGPGTAEQAIQAVATSAGLATERWGNGPGAIHVIASAERLARARGVRLDGLRSSRRIDLAFEHASAGSVLRLLSEAAGWNVTGSLDGEVTLTARNLATQDVGRALLRLAGAEARVQGNDVAVSGGDLPQRANVLAEATCEIDIATARNVSLPCSSPWRFWVGGIATERGRTVALVVGATSSAVVERGDFVGRSEVALTPAPDDIGPVALSWRVHAITADGVVLTQEAPWTPNGPLPVRRLTLGAPPPTPESLDAF